VKVETSLLSAYGIKKSKLSLSGRNNYNYKNAVHVIIICCNKKGWGGIKFWPYLSVLSLGPDNMPFLRMSVIYQLGS